MTPSAAPGRTSPGRCADAAATHDPGRLEGAAVGCGRPRARTMRPAPARRAAASGRAGHPRAPEVQRDRPQARARPDGRDPSAARPPVTRSNPQPTAARRAVAAVRRALESRCVDTVTPGPAYPRSPPLTTDA